MAKSTSGKLYNQSSLVQHSLTSISKWRGVEVAIKVNNMIQDTKGFIAEAKLTL